MLNIQINMMLWIKLFKNMSYTIYIKYNSIYFTKGTSYMFI